MIPTLLEGDGDVPVAARLLKLVDLEIGTTYGLNGKDRIDRRLQAYNHAAKFEKWLVLRDLNGDASCAPELLARLLPHPAPGMCCRIAVRAAESWLIADRRRMAAFLGVRIAAVPTNPDELPDPKGALVTLARHSRRSAIRDDMVPRRGTSSRVGPGYTARIIEYVTEYWRPTVAMATSPSLAKAINAIKVWAESEIAFESL